MERVERRGAFFMEGDCGYEKGPSQARNNAKAPPSLLDQARNLTLLRKSPGLEFRVDSRAVDDDVEDPATSGDEFRVHFQRFLQFGRQTGGGRLVVSLCAVMNLNGHGKRVTSRTRVSSSRDWGGLAPGLAKRVGRWWVECRRLP